MLSRRNILAGSLGVAITEILGARQTAAQSDSYAAIAAASAKYGVGYDWLVSTASCETGGTMSPAADNGRGDVGLFQFKPSTFYSYCSGDPWNAWDAADCAALMFSLGHCGHWCCSGCYPNPCSG